MAITVKELINKLEKMPQNMEVWRVDENSGPMKVCSVAYYCCGIEPDDIDTTAIIIE